jgi:hypothetical protein
MELVLTTASTVSCDHATGGPLDIDAAAASVLTVGGVAVLAGSLGSATIDPGCSQAISSTTGPCAGATSQIRGASQVLTVGGIPVLLADASGTTDSKPPGTWSVKDPAQSVLKAD